MNGLTLLGIVGIACIIGWMWNEVIKEKRKDE